MENLEGTPLFLRNSITCSSNLKLKFGNIRPTYKNQQIKNYLKNKNTPFAKNTMKSSKQVKSETGH